MPAVDALELQTKVKDMYRDVALRPHGEYHFETGRGLAEQLGYSADVLSRIPAEAIESFAGVGHFFDLADLGEGDAVLDLGSGSGMDVFCAALQVGQTGSVVGIDITKEQLEKAEALSERAGLNQVRLVEGPIERLPFDRGSFDCVISNGVINLSPEKERVFAEVARVLKPGGRMAIADIVSEKKLTESIVCSANLWASCIGGAMQEDAYRAAVESAGLRVHVMRENPEYHFISEQARNASAKYGVKSISLLAVKT